MIGRRHGPKLPSLVIAVYSTIVYRCAEALDSMPGSGADGTGRAMSTRYFFFGTLMDRDVLELVLARPVSDDRFEPATLDGYRRVRVWKDSFPMLIADPQSAVDGIVYQTRNADEDARILFFEDFDYGLLPCRPRTADGEVDAMFCGIDTSVAPSDEVWTLEAWARRHKAGFLRLSEIYMNCFGRMTTEEAEPIWEKGRRELMAQGLIQLPPERISDDRGNGAG